MEETQVINPNERAREEAEIRAREEKRRRAEEEVRQKAEEERKNEEKRQMADKLRRLEDERRRLKQEEDLKRMGSDKILPLPPAPPSTVDDTDPLNMKAWYLDDEASKPTLRQLSLKKGKKKGAPPVTLQQLREIGVAYYRVNLNDFSCVNQLVKERCYKHTDEIRISQVGKDEHFIEKWFVEHFNEDEQIRLITDGSCYLDVRSKSDTWIRLECRAGDMVLMAPGAYTRGTLDEDDYCSIMRLFRDAQRWNPISRSDKKADNHPARLQYMKVLKKGSVATDMGLK